MSILSSIEGIPFIIRFKTLSDRSSFVTLYSSIEGIPFIIRFKTLILFKSTISNPSIEGIPFIIRFKT